jgi:hypothetical protein
MMRLGYPIAVAAFLFVFSSVGHLSACEDVGTTITGIACGGGCPPQPVFRYDRFCAPVERQMFPWSPITVECECV